VILRDVANKQILPSRYWIGPPSVVSEQLLAFGALQELHELLGQRGVLLSLSTAA